jgi:hypothetical protein
MMTYIIVCNLFCNCNTFSILDIIIWNRAILFETPCILNSTRTPRNWSCPITYATKYSSLHCVLLSSDIITSYHRSVSMTHIGQTSLMQSAVWSSCHGVIVVSHASADQDNRIIIQSGGYRQKYTAKWALQWNSTWWRQIVLCGNEKHTDSQYGLK